MPYLSTALWPAALALSLSGALLFAYDLWAYSTQRKIGLIVGIGVLIVSWVFRIALAMIGFFAAGGFVHLYAAFWRLSEIAMTVVIGIGVIAGLWASAILTQLIDNLARRCSGKSIQPIEWWRGQRRRRRAG